MFLYFSVIRFYFVNISSYDVYVLCSFAVSILPLHAGYFKIVVNLLIHQNETTVRECGNYVMNMLSYRIYCIVFANLLTV